MSSPPSSPPPPRRPPHGHMHRAPPPAPSSPPQPARPAAASHSQLRADYADSPHEPHAAYAPRGADTLTLRGGAREAEGARTSRDGSDGGMHSASGHGSGSGGPELSVGLASSSVSGSGSASVPPAPRAHDYAVLTLGIETADDSMCCVIPRGTRLPCTSMQLFSTYADQQPGVSILVYQGERASTKNNKFLGRLDLLGIRSAPRGVPRIEVTFTLDAFGNLRVTAHESLYGSVQPLTVQCQFEAPVKHWQTAEVARILEDAELHRAEDEYLMARTAAKSRLEQFCYGIRTSLEHHAWRSLLTADEAALIHEQHQECVRWLQANDSPSTQPEDFQRKLDEVQAICQPSIIKMYEASCSAGSSAQAPAITSAPSDSVMANVSRLEPSPMDDPVLRRHSPAPAAVLHPAAMIPPAAAAATAATASTPAATPAHLPMAAPPVPSPSALSPSPQHYHNGHGNGSLLHDPFGSPPPPHHSMTPESLPYSNLPLHSFAATSSSPLLSSLAPPTGWSSNHFPGWTHPSLLTSPILWSANYHSHSSDSHYASGLAAAAGVHSASANGAGGAGGSNGSLPPAVSVPGGRGSGSLPPAMEEAYMDFLTFPNSATLSLTNVTLMDDETPALQSRAGDSSMLHTSHAYGDERSGSFTGMSTILPHMQQQRQATHELRLRGGSSDRHGPQPQQMDEEQEDDNLH